MADDFPLAFGDVGLLWGRLEQGDATTTLVLRGELDVASVTSLGELLERLQAEGDVVLDVQALGFLDSMGAAVLIAAQRRASTTDAFTILNGSGPAHRTFRIMGLDQVLNLRDGAQEDPV